MGLDNFSIIDSTLREGEQFYKSFFTIENKIKIVNLLDELGVEFIELSSPVVSESSKNDLIEICKLPLKKSKILTHIRCNMEDAKVAVECGVYGIDLVFGTSSILREFSHGKDIKYITEKAKEVITYIKSKGINVRFSSEDSFRSDLVDLLNIYKEVDKIGVSRVGIADTIGCADPFQVFELVKTLRSVVSCDIECHFHNDSDCATANGFSALKAGATHVDCSVLGIGERNGITNLSSFISRMYVHNKENLKRKYNLKILKELEEYVAKVCNIYIPFNNNITGDSCFQHKAGIHLKAMLNNPETYQIINPKDFGLDYNLNFASNLVGHNTIKYIIEKQNLNIDSCKIKDITNEIKNLAGQKQITIEDITNLLKLHHN